MVQAQMTRTERGHNTSRQDNRGVVDDWLVEELHDGVAQSLWYLGVELSALNQEISPHEARLRAQVKTLGEVAQEAYDQVRAILGQTCSPERSEETFDGVVQQEAQSFEERTGVEVRLILESAHLQASGWQAHHLAAIVREALCNAWRHGHARWVKVELKAAEESVSLSVTDRGVGFNPKVLREGHYGMATMQKRARALGGDLEVVSKTGKGARVSLTFPIAGGTDWQSQKGRCSNDESHFDCG